MAGLLKNDTVRNNQIFWVNLDKLFAFLMVKVKLDLIANF